MAAQRQMRLGTFLSSSGEHIGAWRHPETNTRPRADFAQYLEAARVVEDALFDVILLGDVVPSTTTPLEILKYDVSVERLDPFMLISALAATTKNIGLVPTGSTSFEQPYHIARRIASLDHISGGRGGWNAVTTSNSSMALNFNRDDHLQHGDRYDLAEEFIDIVRGLWDSWDEDAFIRDKSTGQYFKPEGLHTLNHKGAHFQVRGPLDSMRTPQGRPVLVQAGSSEDGRQLGARAADVIFTTHATLDSARDFYADIKRRAAEFGRSPDEIRVLVALMPVIGRTQAEAEAKLKELDDLIPTTVSVARLQGQLGGIDLSAYPLDEPLPDDLPEGNGMKSRRQSILDTAKRESLTLRQLASKIAGNRGHWTLTGTATYIADQMEEWFDGGADGFLLVPPRTPQSLQEFTAEVVPELQRRGLFRTKYEGRTLRENLGLKHPARGEGIVTFKGRKPAASN